MTTRELLEQREAELIALVNAAHDGQDTDELLEEIAFIQVALMSMPECWLEAGAPQEPKE